MQIKGDKVGNKTGCKRKGKKKKIATKIELDSQKNITKQKIQILAYAHARKTKQKVLNYILLAEN